MLLASHRVISGKSFNEIRQQWQKLHLWATDLGQWHTSKARVWTARSTDKISIGVTHSQSCCKLVSALSVSFQKSNILNCGCRQDVKRHKSVQNVLICFALQFTSPCLKYEVSRILGECCSPHRNSGLHFLMEKQVKFRQSHAHWSYGLFSQWKIMLQHVSPSLYLYSFYCERFPLLAANKVFNILRQDESACAGLWVSWALVTCPIAFCSTAQHDLCCCSAAAAYFPSHSFPRSCSCRSKTAAPCPVRVLCTAACN